MQEFVKLGVLVGKIIDKIEISEDKQDMFFYCKSGEVYRMHNYDEAEAELNDITGELNDLIDTPIITATEDSGDNEVSEGRSKWTFYNFATIKGYVQLRWIGWSNGFYCEEVSLAQIK